MQNLAIPSALMRLAAGRDNITTKEFAYAIGKQPSTIRKELCLRGHAYNIRPIKIGNALLWPVKDIAAILQTYV